MEPRIMRLLEMSAQAFILTGVWRGASAMAANTTDQLGLLQTLDPFTIPATVLAIIGSAAVTHLGFHQWRKLQRVAYKDQERQPRFVEEPLSLSAGHNRLIADLQHQVLKLTKEKEQLISLLKEKHESMRKDSLTGVFNRVAYEEQLENEYQRWKRFGNPLTFLIWDIDHFKQFNDRYGHAIGDQVLRNVAQQLSGRIRTTDFVARYGGEEFAMLLPGADIKAALKLANQLRLNIAETGFNHGETNLPVTISCGLACFEPGDSPQSVFNRADHALYRAKRAGRNCCWVS